MTLNGLKYMLAEGFEPSEFDFVIGRGKQVKQHAGNKRLYDSIRSIADDYTSADKARKSFLLSHLVKQVYAKSPHAGFVKKDPSSGRWYAVEDALARSSAAQAVRDCLHNHYKSSRQFKQQRRRQAKELASNDSDYDHYLSLAPPAFARNVTPDDTFYTTPATVSMPFKQVTPSGPSCDLQAKTCATVSTSTNLNDDLFSLLSGCSVKIKNDPQDDPFMPLPLAQQQQSQNNMGSIILQEMSKSVNSILEDTSNTQLFSVKWPEPDPFQMATTSIAATDPAMLSTMPVNMNPMAALIPEEDLDRIFD